MISQIIGGIIRTVLAAYGGKLVETGLISNDQLTQAIGGIIFLLTLAWSMFQKYRATKKYNPKFPVRPGIPLE